MHASDALRGYVVALLHRTREDPRVELGASPRAGLLLLRAAKARALLQGRDHALPDDVQALAEVVLAHRIVLAPEAVDADRRADRRRRAGGDAGAVGGARMRPAAATALPRARCCSLTAATFDAEPLYVPGVGLHRPRRRRRRCGSCSARARRAGRRARSARGARSRSEPVRHRPRRLAAGGCRCPAGCIDDDLLPAPAPLASGRRRTRVRIERALRAPRAQGAGAAARSSSATRSASPPASSTADEPAELLVLPRLEPVRHAAGRAATAPGWRRAAGARRSPPRSTSTACARTAPGAPASRIFWPALARGGELMERRLRADGDTRPLVVLDPRGAAREEDLDAAVRAAASLCVHLARAGGCALLLPGDRRPTVLEPTLAGWPHLHVRLALVDDRARPEPRGARPSRRGPVLYVAAHAPGARAAGAAPRVGGGRCRRARAAASAPGRRTGAGSAAARGLHRRRLHRLRAQRQPPRGGGRLMAAAALPRAPLAVAQPPERGAPRARRGWAPSPRWRSSAPCTGAR